MQLLTIVGARPQFIKAAPLSAALRQQHREYLVHTGQHYDANMSDVFFQELNIPPPDRHLGIGSGSHGAQTGQMLQRIEEVLLEQRPQAVLVYGDTNSTLAGALAAAKLNIPVAHVEAGLRSFNRTMPEEINRIAADHLSTWLFAPSAVSVRQLATEGITKGVFDVGDIMADSVRLFRRRAEEHSRILASLRLSSKRYFAATIHRPANTDDPNRLGTLLRGLASLPLPTILACHPRTRAAIDRHGLRLPDGIKLIEPLGYLDMLQFQRQSAAVITDSGGIQKEAYYLEVPCITLREETEWVETVAAGWNRLVGADVSSLHAAAEAAVFEMPRPEHPPLYGDGFSAERISAVLSDSKP